LPGTKEAVPGADCKIVIRTTEIRLSNEKFPEGTDNVLEGLMTSREHRGGLTDHRVQVGSKEIVVTSHKLCPMVRVDGDGGKAFLSIDKSAISMIVGQ
jgi:ABC-type Fe3+/spermidine/putrescine transport system ATPase subunit